MPLDDDDEEEEVAVAAAVSILKISPKNHAAHCLDIEKEHKVIGFFRLGHTVFA